MIMDSIGKINEHMSNLETCLATAKCGGNTPNTIPTSQPPVSEGAPTLVPLPRKDNNNGYRPLSQTGCTQEEVPATHPTVPT